MSFESSTYPDKLKMCKSELKVDLKETIMKNTHLKHIKCQGCSSFGIHHIPGLKEIKTPEKAITYMIDKKV